MAYVLSNGEVEGYREAFGLERSAIKVVGVPRHAAPWIDELSRLTKPIDAEPYIFVASRPTKNSILPLKQKLQILEDIRRLAFDDLRCRVVIRMHPKEYDEAPFDEAFGRTLRGNRWDISTGHPLRLGSRSLFCVSLFSSVAVDMAAIGVPVIERFDPSSVPPSPTFVRESAGDQISVYQKLGIILAARDYAELKEHARSILKDRASVVAGLKTIL